MRLAVGQTVSVAGWEEPAVVLTSIVSAAHTHPKARGVAVAFLMPDGRRVPYAAHKAQIRPPGTKPSLPSAKVNLTISRRAASILLEDEARSRDERLPDLPARLRQSPDELLHDIIDRMIDGRCQRILSELEES